MWWTCSETACDRSRSVSRPLHRGCRFIQNGVAGHGAKTEQDGPGEMIEHVVELLGRIDVAGPTQSQTRSEPNPGRADQTCVDLIGPASQGTLGNHGLARAGERCPLMGLLDPVA